MMRQDRFHKRVNREYEYVPGGVRFTCQQCGAAVGVPTVLVEQWEREHRLDTEIEGLLTDSLLLQTHAPKREKVG